MPSSKNPSWLSGARRHGPGGAPVPETPAKDAEVAAPESPAPSAQALSKSSEKKSKPMVRIAVSVVIATVVAVLSGAGYGAYSLYQHSLLKAEQEKLKKQAEAALIAEVQRKEQERSKVISGSLDWESLSGQLLLISDNGGIREEEVRSVQAIDEKVVLVSPREANAAYEIQRTEILGYVDRFDVHYISLNPDRAQRQMMFIDGLLEKYQGAKLLQRERAQYQRYVHSLNRLGELWAGDAGVLALASVRDVKFPELIVMASSPSSRGPKEREIQLRMFSEKENRMIDHWVHSGDKIGPYQLGEFRYQLGTPEEKTASGNTYEIDISQLDVVHMESKRKFTIKAKKAYSFTLVRIDYQWQSLGGLTTPHTSFLGDELKAGGRAFKILRVQPDALLLRLAKATPEDVKLAPTGREVINERSLSLVDCIVRVNQPVVFDLNEIKKGR